MRFSPPQVFFDVTRRIWKWPLWKSTALLALFLSFDISFFAANVLKFADGGYVPLLVGLLFFIVMLSWKKGTTDSAPVPRRTDGASPDLRAGSQCERWMGDTETKSIRRACRPRDREEEKGALNFSFARRPRLPRSVREIIDDAPRVFV